MEDKRRLKREEEERAAREEAQEEARFKALHNNADQATKQKKEVHEKKEVRDDQWHMSLSLYVTVMTNKVVYSHVCSVDIPSASI